MAKLTYNNMKITKTDYTSFKLNYGYHFCVFYKKDVDPRFMSKSPDELAVELKNLMSVCRDNLQHAQELQKQYHDRRNIKPKSYAPSDKIWLYNKYIKTKQN